MTLLPRAATRSLFLTFALAFGLAAPLSCSAQDSAKSAPPVKPENAQLLREGLRDLITSARDKVYPALVNIHVVVVNYYGGKEQKGAAVGSGTIISKEGYVLTNAHVVNNGKKFKCTLADKEEINAELVGEDTQTDLAILKLNLKELKDPAALPVAQFGNSDELQVGDYVLAMGSPFALSRSVTLGIVSNVERVFAGGISGNDEVEEMDLDGHSTGAYTRWIQHDATINPGNSGGPLVDMKGLIVGINTRGGNNMAFATPSNMAKDIADKLIKFGEVPRSQIGISLKQIEKSGLKEGVLVTSILAGSPAEKAGLKAGDVIVKMNGQAVNVRFAEEIPLIARRIADTPIGGTITFTYLRDGKSYDTAVTTMRMLKDKGDETALRGWGLTVEEITERIALELRLDSRDGVIVTGVKGGGPAALAEPPIADGDIITAIGGQKIKTLADAVERYKSIMDKDEIPEYLMIQFDRKDRNQVTLIKPKPDKREDPAREVPKAWLGIETQPVLRNLAKELGNEKAEGFRITRIYPKTLAAASELKVGDIIIALGGDKMVPRGMQDAGNLNRRIRTMKSEDKAVFTVIRDDKTIEVPVMLERSRIGKDEARKDENKDFELVVREVTFFDRADERWDDSVTGVIVEGAERAGWAGLGGLSSGDLIQRIDNTEITDITAYRKAMEAIKKAQPERVTFVVLRGTQTHYKFVEPDWKPQLEQKKDGDKAAKPAQ